MSFSIKSLLKFTLIFIFILNINVHANTSWDNNMSATPTVFKVKPTDMKLCEDFSLSTGECSGSSIYTIVKTMTADDGRCDIAGVEQGAVACNYGPTNSMPVGVTYNYVRIELDRTMWLKGTVTNTGSNSELASCHTDSANTQASNSVYAEGSVGGTATLQAINFANGAGNESFIGNATKDTANTLDTYGTSCVNNPSLSGCSFGYVASLKAQGSTHYGTDEGSTQTFGSQDYWMFTGYFAPQGNIWQSDLIESDTSMVLIYKLTSPYSRSSADIFPTIKMSFDVTDALDSDFIKSEEAGKDDVKTCTLYVGSPGVTISITD